MQIAVHVPVYMVYLYSLSPFINLIYFILFHSVLIIIANIVYLFFSFSSPPPRACVFSSIIYYIENEDENASHSPDREGNAFLDECKKDVGKRRASLAAKMTSNLRRLSGAAELKIDINDPVSSNNPKYCNKKIKVSVCTSTRPTGQTGQHNNPVILFVSSSYNCDLCFMISLNGPCSTYVFFYNYMQTEN